MKTRFALSAIALLVIPGCGTPSSSSADTSTEVAETSSPSAPTTKEIEPQPSKSPSSTPSPTPTTSIFESGQPATHEGVEITVHSSVYSPTVSRNLSGYRAGSGYESFTAQPADAGGRFTIVTATVKNVGKESLDLTCGWPIEFNLVDSEERLYDPVESLYEIEGNPECNSQLQPGFASDVTYPFLVPTDSQVTGLLFRDTNSEFSQEPAGIRLSVTG